LPWTALGSRRKLATYRRKLLRLVNKPRIVWRLLRLPV
jgi:hypothetical protein